jgi:hypothetical protein
MLTDGEKLPPLWQGEQVFPPPTGLPVLSCPRTAAAPPERVGPGKDAVISDVIELAAVIELVEIPAEINPRLNAIPPKTV